MRSISAVLGMVLSVTMVAQWSVTGNSGTTPGTNYLGTQDQQRMLIKTYAKWRLMVNEDDAYTINGFSSLPAYGFTAISPTSSFWGSGPGGPFSRLHLAEGSGTNNQDQGYRPWMRNGITFTGNSDMGYIGQKYTYNDSSDYTSGEQDDYTDMIINWSDNPGTWLSDRLRFIFTSDYDASTTGNGSLEGLEAMQLYPHDSGSEVFVGIGDWFAAAATPSERLDVLDRTIRIRRLVPDYEDQSLEKFVVTDDNGRLHWADKPQDCDWTVIPGSGAGTNDVYTAYGSATDDCPDETEAVGIGTNAPGAKLHVNTSNFGTAMKVIGTMSTTTNKGVYVETSGGSSSNYGLDVSSTQGSATNAASYGVNVRAIGSGASGNSQNYGVRASCTGTTYRSRGFEATTDGATFTSYAGNFISHDHASYANGVEGYSDDGILSSHGVYGIAESDAEENFGVHGEANGTDDYAYYGVYGEATSSGSTPVVIGVYGTASGSGSDIWAMYSEGDQYSTSSSTWNTSDAMFKDNVEDLSDALDLIELLEPKTFTFDTATYGYMHFSSRPQFGMIAQDVENVIPTIVREVHRPADLDSSGNVVHAPLDFKAMQYGALIPVLVAALKEQQATIDDQASRLDDLEQSLASCCSSMNGSGSQSMTLGSNMGVDAPSKDKALGSDLTIAPNPFTESTTLSYLLAKAGQMRLDVSSSEGLHIVTLRSGRQEAGAYSMTWNTQDLAAGIYYITLYQDGEQLVRKAVKVSR
ncbi:MAG: tail fiber domain-containing protein [Flavobacteriales bacterium]|nr:tail fiber domain-containing protein [Flavobacteriales bacterium]MCB9167174.1 tail fiber domain-containing protein [Flavobacteriales bacterium]